MEIDQFSAFFFISLLAAALSLFLAYTSQRLKPSPGVVPFSWMMVSIGIWSGAVAFGMLSSTEQTASLWIEVRMIGVIFTPLAWLSMVLEFTGREKLITNRSLLLLALIPITSLVLLLTNQIHGLFYSNIEFMRSGPFLVDKSWTSGWYFYIHLLYSYSLVLAGDFLLLKEAVQMAHQHRRQALILVLSTIIPLFVNVSYTFHIIPVLMVNYDPLGFVLTGLLMGWGIYFKQLFDLSPFARSLLVEHMVDGMIVVNQSNQIVDLNPAVKRILSINDDVIGITLNEMYKRLDIESLEEAGLSHHQYITITAPRRTDRFYEVYITLIYGRKDILGKLITLRDVTRQKMVEEQLQYLAITDALTGLANHRHFYELLDQELSRARRNWQPFSVIIFDIDLFKKVNDNHGHLIGDQVLREIAIICKDALRQYDIICRYGGEEFAVILPNTRLREAAITAERLRRVVSDYEFDIEDLEFKLTISLGVSCYNPEAPVPPKFLVDQADRSLYYSKQNGRNLVTTFQQMEKELEDR